jgi:hypothetical protein
MLTSSLVSRAKLANGLEQIDVIRAYEVLSHTDDSLSQ